MDGRALEEFAAKAREAADTARVTGQAFAAIHESLSMVFRRLDDMQQELKAVREALHRAGVRV